MEYPSHFHSLLSYKTPLIERWENSLFAILNQAK